MSGSVSSYPKILAFGHRMIERITDGPVVVEEKVDGSQFSFGVIGGQLMCRSKGQQIILDAADKMFDLGIATAKALQQFLLPEAIYRGEYLNKPKHNTLTYERVPKLNFILFDVEIGLQKFMSRAEKEAEAARLGLEVVPCFFEGELMADDIARLRNYLSNVSILGGQKVEGIVVKNYNQFNADGKICVAKVVSEEFKEIHQGEWKKTNPAPIDIVTGLIAGLATPARFNKAIQRRKEAGEYLGAPQDIGPLIRSIQTDVDAEASETIKEALFKHAWPVIARGIVKDFPQFFKKKLLEDALGEPPAAHEYKDLGQETAAVSQADGVPS